MSKFVLILVFACLMLACTTKTLKSSAGKSRLRNDPTSHKHAHNHVGDAHSKNLDKNFTESFDFSTFVAHNHLNPVHNKHLAAHNKVSVPEVTAHKEVSAGTKKLNHHHQEGLNYHKNSKSMHLSHSSHEKHSFVQTGQLAGLSNVKVSTDPYGCAGGFNYLPYEYALASQDEICKKSKTWDINRLMGGGSIDGPGYGCQLRPFDPRPLNGAVCSKYTLSNLINSAKGETCPSGYVALTTADTTNNQKALCNMMGQWDIARVGAQGSMDGPGYGCKIKEVDTRSLGNALCGKISIESIAVATNINEGVCGATKSPLTTKEAIANKQAICDILGQWDIARLAGGASIDGPGYGCNIKYSDGRGMGNVICASAYRNTI